MSNRRIEMYQYRQVIVRMRQGESDRAIARTGLLSRSTTRSIRSIALINGWLNLEHPLPDDAVIGNVLSEKKAHEAKSSSKVASHSEQIKAWVEQGIQATVIHRVLVEGHGLTASYNSVQRFVQSIKLRAPDLTIPLNFKPGEAAQVDFGYGPKLLNQQTGIFIKTWVFVMTLCWSRHQYAEIIYDQKIATWLGCHRRAFEWFNGVPSKIIIDNAKCAITTACFHEPIIQRAYADCAQEYGFIISACPPYDPQKKGRVESGVKYVKKNFLPLRTFQDIGDANQQIKQWILAVAGNRIHGSTRHKPLSQFEEIERVLLKPLPDIPPDLCQWFKVKVYRDCHVRFNYCRYSAPYYLVNKELWLRASETTIRLYDEHHMVAVHPRINTPDNPATISEHLPLKASEFLLQEPNWCREKAQQIGQACFKVVELLLNDKICDYLRAAQGVIKLEKTYGALRVESACQRALCYETPQYKVIKSILSKGLDSPSLTQEQAFDTLSEAYTGKGQFSRDPKELIH